MAGGRQCRCFRGGEEVIDHRMNFDLLEPILEVDLQFRRMLLGVFKNLRVCASQQYGPHSGLYDLLSFQDIRASDQRLSSSPAVLGVIEAELCLLQTALAS